ncbi:MAG: indole-3-glycerol phosphate synthase TrpC [Pseudomonadota bacterium]
MNRDETVLDRILAGKRKEIETLKKSEQAGELENQARRAGPTRDFIAALRDCPHAAVIAEIKKASPSAGTIRTAVDPAEWARIYEQNGAAALSVLTDGPFFGGGLDDLVRAREAVRLPVLRKDFILDPLQVYQTRAAGADAMLLIAAALSPVDLKELFFLALDLGLAPLVEVHNRGELETVMELDPPLVGINNRNLADLRVDLETCLNLRPLVTNQALVVGESGIKGPEDLARLSAGGLHAFLVGSTLMTSDDPGAKLADLCRAGVSA